MASSNNGRKHLDLPAAARPLPPLPFSAEGANRTFTTEREASRPRKQPRTNNHGKTALQQRGAPNAGKELAHLQRTLRFVSVSDDEDDGDDYDDHDDDDNDNVNDSDDDDDNNEDDNNDDDNDDDDVDDAELSQGSLQQAMVEGGSEEGDNDDDDDDDDTGHRESSPPQAAGPFKNAAMDMGTAKPSSEYDTMARTHSSSRHKDASFASSSSPPPGLASYCSWSSYSRLSHVFRMLDGHDDDDDNDATAAPMLALISWWISQPTSFLSLLLQPNYWGDTPLHYWVRNQWKSRRLIPLLRVILLDHPRFSHVVYCRNKNGCTVLDTCASVWTAMTSPRNGPPADKDDDDDNEEEEEVDLTPVSHQEEGALYKELVRALAPASATAAAAAAPQVSPDLAHLCQVYKVLLQAGQLAVERAAAAATKPRTRRLQVSTKKRGRVEHGTRTSGAAAAAGDQDKSNEPSPRFVLQQDLFSHKLPLSYELLSKRLDAQARTTTTTTTRPNENERNS